MFCARCGAQCAEGSTFCIGCGHRLVVPQAQVAPKVQVPKNPGKTFALIAMILGLASLVTFVSGAASGLTLPAAVVAVVLATISKNRSRGADMPIDSNANIGLICGFIGIGLSVLSAVVALFLSILSTVIYYIVSYGLEYILDYLFSSATTYI